MQLSNNFTITFENVEIDPKHFVRYNRPSIHVVIDESGKHNNTYGLCVIKLIESVALNDAITKLLNGDKKIFDFNFYVNYFDTNKKLCRHEEIRVENLHTIEYSPLRYANSKNAHVELTFSVMEIIQ